MSDPVQNSDVEDVLSSIRRLVSEDDRPKAKAPEPTASDRLVLTPSLRVAEPAPADEAEEAEDGDALESADWTAADTDEHQSEASADNDAEDDPDWFEVEDDGVEHSAVESDDADADDMDDATADVPEAQEDALEDEAAEEVADDADTASQSLSDKIAALEAVIARRDDQWEPDTAGADDYAGTEDADMTWEDAAPETDQPEVFAADEDVLDEDALRDLVAEIVREELQGALGERITRNVRKLVRREIHRALAAQELD